MQEGNKAMGYQRIITGGIGYIEPVEGCSSWYWGADAVRNDLYEARELYELNQRTDRNRLILLHDPEGTVYEPVSAEAWQYFGKPVCENGTIFFPAVLFEEKIIRIFGFDMKTCQTEIIEEIPLEKAGDCCNLCLHVSPLTLCTQRQGSLNLIWPEAGRYDLGGHETFVYRDHDFLICSEWHEDPDYREEIVIRRITDGAVTERTAGTAYLMPSGNIRIIA